MPRHLRRLPVGPGALALVLLAGLGALSTGFATGGSGFATSPYRAERLTAIAIALSNLEGDYILAAGDSQILRWPARTLCGLPVVNAGIDGATSDDLAHLIAALDLHRPPRAAIVTIGTNDTFRKRAASPEQAVRRFEAGLDRALDALGRRTPRIVLNAPPPIDDHGRPDFWAEAIPPIGTAAEAACLRNRTCRFLAPFGAGTVLAADGVHLRDYATAYARLEGPACTAILGRYAAMAGGSR